MVFVVVAAVTKIWIRKIFRDFNYGVCSQATQFLKAYIISTLLCRLIGTHPCNTKVWASYLFSLVSNCTTHSVLCSSWLFCIPRNWLTQSSLPELSCPLASGWIQPIWGINGKSESEKTGQEDLPSLPPRVGAIVQQGSHSSAAIIGGPSTAPAFTGLC